MDFMNQEGVRFTLNIASLATASELENLIDEIDDDILTNGEPEEQGIWFASAARDALMLELMFKRPAYGTEEA